LFTTLKKESELNDLVVVYYTGHGARDEERFYILSRDSNLSDLDSTALPAEDLARALIKDSKASQVLVILDACYAGAGAAEFTQITGKLAQIIGGLGPAVFVLAAARSKQEAEQGALSTALAESLTNADQRLGGTTQPFLALDSVLWEVSEYLKKKHPGQIATMSVTNWSDRCRLLPNPHYRPDVPPGLDLGSQRALQEHWIPKARSAELGAKGWYFTGREKALEELSDWLKAKKPDNRVLVVTGGAGCGKSAVLARITTLADPTYRNELLSTKRSKALNLATVPPKGVIDVKVHARRKLLGAIVSQIASDLGLKATTSEELLTVFQHRKKKTVILIDSLDEADERDDIVSQLFKPLAEKSNVLLLIGTRPDSAGSGRRFQAFGENTVEIDLDKPRYTDKEDIIRYVERRLLAAEEPSRPTPYRNSPKIVRKVAKALAKKAGSVFLIAHTAVHSLLANSSMIDITKPEWMKQLPTGIEDAFEQFLDGIDRQRPGGLTSEKALAVLRALAYSEGEGLPWADVWSTVAGAISNLDVSNADISLVQEYAAAFIVEALEHERSVYRLYHERIAEHLRGSSDDEKHAHKQIVMTLCQRLVGSPTTKSPDWTHAHPYLLTHLATHASKSDMLHVLLVNPQYLVHAEPIRLLSALEGKFGKVDSQNKAKEFASVYRLASHYLLRTQDIHERTAYLELIAHQQGATQAISAFQTVSHHNPWRVRWACLEPLSEHRILAREDYGIAAIWVGVVSNRPVVIAADYSGIVKVRDPNDGRVFLSLGPVLCGRNRLNLTISEMGNAVGIIVREYGRPHLDFEVLASIDLEEEEYEERTLADEYFNPNNEPLDLYSRPNELFTALGTISGKALAVFVRDSGLVQVLNLENLKLMFQATVRIGKNRELSSAALGVKYGKGILVLGDKKGKVSLYDIEKKGLKLQRSWQTINQEIRALAIRAVGGVVNVVAGTGDGLVSVWHIDQGKHILQESWSHEYGRVTSISEL